MSDQCDSMAATTVANAMREGPSFHTVQFPSTGDPELDTISGIITVLNRAGLRAASEIACLHFLLERSQNKARGEFEEVKRQQRERERIYRASQQFPQGIGAGQAIGPICPPNPGDWTLGGAPYPSQLVNPSGQLTTSGRSAFEQALANATFQPGKGPLPGRTLAEVFMEEQKRETLKKTLEDYATPPQIKR